LIKGRTIQIPLTPQINKDVEEFERIQVDARNGRITDANNFVKRAGYSQKWDIAEDFPISLLIPKGYAISSEGTIYILNAVLGTATEIKATATLARRPTWIQSEDGIILAYGGVPLLIDGTSVTSLSTAAPQGLFVSSVATYVIISGHHPTEIRWSAPDAPTSWPAANFTNIEPTGTIQFQLEHKKRLYFFKETEIEVFSFTGTDPPFRRQTGLTMDVGLGAKDSVIKTDDTFFWYGDDGNFYVFDGSNPRRLSDSYFQDMDKMNNAADLVGNHIQKEKIVQWTSPIDGKTYSYDYQRGSWIEDNEWSGCWQSLPFLSYAEIEGKQYYGSRKLDGLIHEWSTDFEDDNGEPIRVLRTVSLPLTQSGNSARVNRARFRRKGGVANDSETAPVFMVRTRLDKGSWRHYDDLTMGTEGQHNPYVDLYSIGIGRELEIEITETDATDYLMTDVILTVQELRQ
jgi:hypothetical protein